MSSPQYDEFIRRAGELELPVRFLSTVAQSSYKMITLPGDHGLDRAIPAFHLLVFESQDWISLDGLAPGAFRDALHGMYDIYHESVHAWIDLKKDRADVAELIRTSVGYYEAAGRLKSGAKMVQPDRVFQEAIADYVTIRVSAYWIALGSLETYTEELRRSTDASRIDYFIRRARRARDTYNLEMAKRVFGYEKRLFREQDDTITNITAGIKTFADHELLEDRIPDQFSASPQLSLRWSAIQSIYPKLEY